MSFDLLQVTKFYYPKVGGVERVVKDLAEGFAERDASVRVLSSVERGFGGGFRHNGVSVSKVSSLGTALSVPLAPSFPLHLNRATKRADITHFHLPDPLSVTSNIIAGDSHTRTVATFHGDIVRQARSLELYRPVLNHFLEKVDRIVVTSPPFLEHSQFLSSFHEKCRVVPIGLDLDEYGEPRKRLDLPIAEDDTMIFFAGRLIYYKGLEYLIGAMEDTPGKLVIAGDGALREELEQMVNEGGLTDKVHFLGYVSDEELRYCYDRADIFSFPSIATSEGFGIVQLEAMAYGTPVVNTSLKSGVPWVSQDGHTGLTVPPKDSEALSEAITKLVEHPEIRRRYGENARKRVETEFSRERMLNRMNDVYQGLLN